MADQPDPAAVPEDPATPLDVRAGLLILAAGTRYARLVAEAGAAGTDAAAPAGDDHGR